MTLLQIILTGLFAIYIVTVSWRPLRNPGSHGFYRFFGFVATGAVIVVNLPVWTKYSLSVPRLAAELCLGISIWYVIAGFRGLKRYGGRADRLESPETLGFENTSRLVTRGIFRYIRHPMYASLIFLAWGSCLKRVDIITAALAVIATVALAATAKIEERENLAFFGEEYRTYMTRSRMFIPYIL
jgi:protein-S-isoprenylcysteine O-methyltransferase Ste14